MTVIQDEVALPTPASLLGTPVTLVELDYTDPTRGLVAVCNASDGAGEVAFAADALAARLHAAYLHYLGLKPDPASPQTRLDLAVRLTADCRGG